MNSTLNRCCVLNAPLSDPEAENLAAILKTLADPVRLRLVSLIATAPGGDMCACDLPQAVGRAQPTVSHHLTQLTNAGLLQREQRGKWAWFRVQPEFLATIRRMLGEGSTTQTLADTHPCCA